MKPKNDVWRNLLAEMTIKINFNVHESTTFLVISEILITKAFFFHFFTLYTFFPAEPTMDILKNECNSI